MMQVSTSGNDFMPFPSQAFATMYMVVHSPRPMVCFRMLLAVLILNGFHASQGESNLKFIWYLISQVHHETPSLNSVKSFVLPEYSGPQKVCCHPCMYS